MLSYSKHIKSGLVGMNYSLQQLCYCIGAVNWFAGRCCGGKTVYSYLHVLLF